MNDEAESSPVSARDRHLFGPGPKRLLALDGGGVRGAITVAFLEHIEKLASRGRPESFRLGDYFDFVGGTSTGAIIAGALALGYRTDQVREFYTRLAPHVFKRAFWRIPILQARFDLRGLRHEIEAIVGDRSLGSEDIITGLGIVTKRMDTGSPWILTNNPRAPYWETGADFLGNKFYKLALLVRASTAAPNYFDPELLPISETDVSRSSSGSEPNRFLRGLLQHAGISRPHRVNSQDYGLFVDGAVSPYNNPSLAFFQMMALHRLGICWRLGPENLTIVSIGTGTHRPRLRYETLGFARTPKLAYYALLSLMSDAEVATLAQLQWLGECPAPWPINSELGTLADDAPPGGKLFRFIRYDVRLEHDWLKAELGIEVTTRDLTHYRAIDDPGVVNELFAIGRVAAERFVKQEHWT